jgi:hypothetical protein
MFPAPIKTAAQIARDQAYTEAFDRAAARHGVKPDALGRFAFAERDLMDESNPLWLAMAEAAEEIAADPRHEQARQDDKQPRRYAATRPTRGIRY